MSFTWLVAMIMAAADVKPTETGPEMKSIKNPERKEFAREGLLTLNCNVWEFVC